MERRSISKLQEASRIMDYGGWSTRNTKAKFLQKNENFTRHGIPECPSHQGKNKHWTTTRNADRDMARMELACHRSYDSSMTFTVSSDHQRRLTIVTVDEEDARKQTSRFVMTGPEECYSIIFGCSAHGVTVLVYRYSTIHAIYTVYFRKKNAGQRVFSTYSAVQLRTVHPDKNHFEVRLFKTSIRSALSYSVQYDTICEITRWGAWPLPLREKKEAREGKANPHQEVSTNSACKEHCPSCSSSLQSEHSTFTISLSWRQY